MCVAVARHRFHPHVLGQALHRLTLHSATTVLFRSVHPANNRRPSTQGNFHRLGPPPGRHPSECPRDA